MAKEFDAASKHLIETRPRDWLALAGFPVPESDADVHIVDADLSNVISVSADKLIRVDNPAGGFGPYVAHIEFQSSADAKLDHRVLHYNIVSRRRHELPVWSAVFLLRPEAAHSNTIGRVSERLDAVSSLDFSYHLVRVWELSPETILSGGIGVLPLAPITAVKPADLAPLIEKARERIKSELPQQLGSDFLVAMRLLMGLRYEDRLTEILMQSVFEMRDSVEWQKIFRSGEAEGRAKGKAEGRAEGKAEGERALLIRLGTARFGPPSDAVLKRLESITDDAELQNLGVRILTAQSWDSLFDA